MCGVNPDATDASGRPMVPSLSPGPSHLDQAVHLQAHANQWRVCNDFWDTWPQLRDNLVNLVKWAPNARPGAWPDADMLPLGKIGLRNYDGEPPRRCKRDSRAGRSERRHAHAHHRTAWRKARALRLITSRPPMTSMHPSRTFATLAPVMSASLAWT